MRWAGEACAGLRGGTAARDGAPGDPATRVPAPSAGRAPRPRASCTAVQRCRLFSALCVATRVWQRTRGTACRAAVSRAGCRSVARRRAAARGRARYRLRAGAAGFAEFESEST